MSKKFMERGFDGVSVLHYLRLRFSGESGNNMETVSVDRRPEREERKAEREERRDFKWNVLL
jgi:hypothetical protein